MKGRPARADKGLPCSMASMQNLALHNRARTKGRKERIRLVAPDRVGEVWTRRSMEVLSGSAMTRTERVFRPRCTDFTPSSSGDRVCAHAGRLSSFDCLRGAAYLCPRVRANAEPILVSGCGSARRLAPTYIPSRSPLVYATLPLVDIYACIAAPPTEGLPRCFVKTQRIPACPQHKRKSSPRIH